MKVGRESNGLSLLPPVRSSQVRVRAVRRQLTLLSLPDGLLCVMFFFFFFFRTFLALSLCNTTVRCTLQCATGRNTRSAPEPQNRSIFMKSPTHAGGCLAVTPRAPLTSRCLSYHLSSSTSRASLEPSPPSCRLLAFNSDRHSVDGSVDSRILIAQDTLKGSGS
ncbi:hypothetical protein PYCCODRAFT_389375 [Trametes coccinea BRFM310]|uniref:Transmembrane protein n=1 Tax=Trametes coccinea (strain BRFM310) TaxID=1353009 RepID=A0A1Y2J6Q4_TRAC3|nr:hypothetical protein PYCCODRAFT_389375 [Trametes coccinea BRFM310]